MLVTVIDSVQTIITSVKTNIAKGMILNADLTTTPCYVVKQDDKFAHGKTVREAREALLTKLFDDMPKEERIEEFAKSHKAGKAYPNRDFFEWHGRLTGSCAMGREAFARDNGIDLGGSMTVAEFVEVTKNAYGKETVRELAARYEGSGE